jgi:hypothetical protein
MQTIFDEGVTRQLVAAIRKRADQGFTITLHEFRCQARSVVPPSDNDIISWFEKEKNMPSLHSDDLKPRLLVVRMLGPTLSSIIPTYASNERTCQGKNVPNFNPVLSQLGSYNREPRFIVEASAPLPQEAHSPPQEQPELPRSSIILRLRGIAAFVKAHLVLLHYIAVLLAVIAFLFARK